MQSIMLIILQLVLLRVCVIARNQESEEYQKMQISSGSIQDHSLEITTVKLLDFRNF